MSKRHFYYSILLKLQINNECLGFKVYIFRVYGCRPYGFKIYWFMDLGFMSLLV